MKIIERLSKAKHSKVNRYLRLGIFGVKQICSEAKMKRVEKLMGVKCRMLSAAPLAHPYLAFYILHSIFSSLHALYQPDRLLYFVKQYDYY